MCRLCSQLCCRTLAPATSPLPLSGFVGAAGLRFYTESIAQQRLCDGNKKDPPSPRRQRLTPTESSTRENMLIHSDPAIRRRDPATYRFPPRDDKVVNPPTRLPSVGRPEGEATGSVHLAANAS